MSSSWVKLDTGFWENPKVWEAGLDGGIVFQLVLFENYRGKHGGMVPGDRVSEKRLFMKLAAYGFTLERARTAIQACVAAGLLELGSAGDVVIPGFDTEWQARTPEGAADDADCGHCGRHFLPSRKGHIYCSAKCRFAARAREADASSPADQPADASSPGALTMPRSESPRRADASSPFSQEADASSPRGGTGEHANSEPHANVRDPARECTRVHAAARGSTRPRGDPRISRNPRESQSQSQRVLDSDFDLNGGTTLYASTLPVLAHGLLSTVGLAADRPGPGHQPLAAEPATGGFEAPPGASALEGRMQVLGLFQPDERRARALCLASEGMTVEDFDILVTHAQCGHSPLRLLASFLRRPSYGWRDDLADALKRQKRSSASTERSA